MINMENREENINLIAGRIMDEYRKHPSLEWHKIAASKIHSQWFEYYEKQNKALLDEIEILKDEQSLLTKELNKFRDEIDMLKFQLKAADSVNEWISVEDRLPEINSNVICSNINDEWVCCGNVNIRYHWYNQFQDEDIDCRIYPTHWMPLPNNLKHYETT